MYRVAGGLIQPFSNAITGLRETLPDFTPDASKLLLDESSIPIYSRVISIANLVITVLINYLIKPTVYIFDFLMQIALAIVNSGEGALILALGLVIFLVCMIITKLIIMDGFEVH